MNSITRYLSFIVFLPLVLLQYACSNNDDLTSLNPTELEVSVKDSTGLLLPGAEVTLYRNLRDLEANTNVVARQFTQSNGVAMFSNVQPVNYYFLVEYLGSEVFISNYGNYEVSLLSDNFNNGNNFTLADRLTENGLTRITINCSFYKSPIPKTVRIDGLQFFFVNNSANVLSPSEDTIMLYFGIFENLDLATPIGFQMNKVIAFDSAEFYDLDVNRIGLKDILEFNTELDADAIFASIQPDGTLSTEYYLIALYNDENLGRYEYAFEYLTLFEDLGKQLFSLIANDQYPYRVKNGLKFNGNDEYEMDIIMNWK